MSMTVGLFLAPVAGSVARFSLVWPFLISAAICACGLLFALCRLPADGEANQAADSDIAQEQGEEEVISGGRSSWADLVLWLFFLGSFFVGIIIQGEGFINNLQVLQGESFGVWGPDDSLEERAQLTTQMLSLVVLPMGIISTLTSVLL